MNKRHNEVADLILPFAGAGVLECGVRSVEYALDNRHDDDGNKLHT